MTMRKVIVLTLPPLEDAKGNLKSLKSDWEGSSSVSCRFDQSKGKATEYMKQIIALVPSITTDVSTLMGNSISFFESLGYSFKELDKKASDDIKKIGGSSASGSSGGGTR